MVGKIKDLSLAMMSKIPFVSKFLVSKPSTQFVMVFLFFYGVLLALFVYGWCFQFRYQGIIDLPILINAFRETVTPAAVTAINSFSSAMVDLNKNGVPDIYEKEVQNNVKENR